MDRMLAAPSVVERVNRRGILRRGGIVALAITGAGVLLDPLRSLARASAANPKRPARAAAASDPLAGADIVLDKSLRITHGNAGHTAWSEDGRTLYLANEEGSTSNIKLDVSDPTNIRIVAMQSFINFSWAVDARHGIVLYRESIGGTVVRVDPQKWTKLWSWSGGRGHAVLSDGKQAYVPIIGNPAAVAVLDLATGAERQRLSVSQQWPDVFSMGIAEDAHLLVVGAQSSGTSLFDTGGGRIRQIGQINEPALLLALAGTKLYTATGTAIQRWDLTTPTAPVKTGTWAIPVNPKAGRAPEINDLAASPDGRRLFATYMSRVGQNPDLGQPAGVYMLDITGAAPLLRQTLDMLMPGGRRFTYPQSVAVSPNGRTLAFTEWSWGVFLFDISQDRFTPYSRDGWGFATVGEARDAFTDGKFVYVWAHDIMQIFDLATGVRTASIPAGDGGWRPFRDGHLIMLGSPQLEVVHLGNGTAREVTRLTDLSVHGSGTNWVEDVLYDDPYVYAAGEGGYLHIGKIDPWNGTGYPFTLLANHRVSSNPPPGNIPMALCKAGNQVWVNGHGFGVIAVDVSDPAHPKTIYADQFTFGFNAFTSMAAAAGRVYVGCGNQGVRIYDPASLKLTGSLPGSARGSNGLSANFVDVYKNARLLIANYWYPQLPEGMYVYDISTAPDSPRLVRSFPLGPNFRVRAFNNLGLVIRIGLGSADIFKVKG
jgi:hypothetical protein